MKKLKIIILITLFFLTAGLSSAEEKTEPKPPIDITSDTLEATGEDIVFVGNVNVVYGDITINADNVQLFYESKREGESEEKEREIKSITATGNVEFIEIGRQAWADKMVYEKGSGVATLTGNPRIRQENNTIKGDLIKIFIDEDRVEIKGNVKAVVNPEKLEE
jgi:lipopolysaccharide export system protein LptA